jgi:hypothetical protein
MAVSLAPLSVPPVVSRRRAFRRIFNGATVALVFYVVVVTVFGQTATKLLQGPEGFAFTTALLVRQHLVSGLLVLLAIAAGEALWPQHAGQLRPLAGRFALVGLAAAAAAAIRLLLVSSGPGEHLPLAWFANVWSLWTTLGMLGCAVSAATWRERQARDALLEAGIQRERGAARALEARLSALQAQIEPHFLFNTLANVRRLYETEPHRGRQMLGCLVDYLRVALPAMRGADNPLGRELELARSYLTVLQMRMGARMQFSIDASRAPPDARLPSMVLPTLVENAFKHGLAPLPEGGSITIRATRDRDDLVIEVADSGRGFTRASGFGVGLANTRARLAALYGDRARLALRGNQPRGVIAEVRIPLQGAAAVAS